MAICSTQHGASQQRPSLYAEIHNGIRNCKNQKEKIGKKEKKSCTIIGTSVCPSRSSQCSSIHTKQETTWTAQIIRGARASNGFGYTFGRICAHKPVYLETFTFENTSTLLKTFLLGDYLQLIFSKKNSSKISFKIPNGTSYFVKRIMTHQSKFWTNKSLEVYQATKLPRTLHKYSGAKTVFENTNDTNTSHMH